MIGYGVDRSNFKRVSDYIRSWLDRYKIEHEEVMNPHFTIAMIPDEVNKDELVRDVQSIKSNVSFTPKSISLFEGKRTPNDYIVVEYKPNEKFFDAFWEIAKKHTVVDFGKIKPHTSLFILKKGKIPKRMWKDIKYSMPPLPKVTTKKVELWNDRHEIEFVA